MFSVDFTLQNFEYFLLILVRISMFLVVAPFFNLPNVPAMAKVGFAAIVSFLLYFNISFEGLDYGGVMGYGFLVVKEAITGLILGYAGYICNSIILYAGTLISMDVGLSMATEFDPTSGTVSPVLASLYQYIILMLLIVSDLHRYLIRALVDSYQLIPIGGTIFRMDQLLKSILETLSAIFIVGFRVALPVFVCIMILNCVLGIMAKVAPQMNMFAVGIQLKILVGFAAMFLTIFMLPQVCDLVLTQIRLSLVSIIKGLY